MENNLNKNTVNKKGSKILGGIIGTALGALAAAGTVLGFGLSASGVTAGAGFLGVMKAGAAVISTAITSWGPVASLISVTGPVIMGLGAIAAVSLCAGIGVAIAKHNNKKKIARNQQIDTFQNTVERSDPQNTVQRSSEENVKKSVVVERANNIKNTAQSFQMSK